MVKEALELLKRKRVIKIIEVSESILGVYYDSYIGREKFVDYTSFLNFCKHFDIYPKLCSRITLHSAFYTMAFIKQREAGDLFSRSSMSITIGGHKTEPQTESQLDFHLFIKALILCAFQAKSFENDKNITSKMIRLIKRMAQSTGARKMINLVSTIK